MKFKRLLLIFAALSCSLQNLYAPFMTITQAGDYDLSADTSYSPGSTNDTIIQISTSNVSINLGGHTISQGNLTAGLSGITVNPNLTNIRIQNGYIQNITGTGVGIGQGCSRITIDDITTFSCDSRGINISGIINAPIKNCLIKNCSLLNCCQTAAGDNVLTLSHCVNLQVKDCFLNQNGINPGALDVARLVTCTRCELLSLEANDNIASGTIHVFNLTDSYQCIIRNCITNNTSSAQADAYGVEIDGMFNLVNDNLIQNTYSTATTSSNTVAGISLKSTASGNQILDNTITNSFALISTSSVVFVYGIQMQNSLDTITSTTQFVTGVTVNAIAWSPNGRYVATGENTTNFRVFEFDGTTLVQAAPSFAHGAAINSIAWSPDGRYVALAGLQSGGIVLRAFEFDGTSLTAAGTLTIAGGGTTVLSISWSPSGRFIALGTNVTPEMRVINFPGDVIALTAAATFAHGAQVNSVSWSPDERFIAMGGVVGTGTFTTRVISFILSSAATTILTSAGNFNHGATVSEVSFSPSMRFIAQGGAASAGVTLRALSFNGSSLTSSAPADISTGATVNAAGWSADGRFLASGQNAGGGAEVRAFTFDGTTLVQAQTFSHGAAVNSLDWSVDGQSLAIGGVVSTQEVKILSGLTFPELCTINENRITNIRGGNVAFGFGRGTGMSVSGAANVAIQNEVFNCDLNYRYTKNVFKSFLTNVFNPQEPPTIANLSFPPL